MGINLGFKMLAKLAFGCGNIDQELDNNAGGVSLTTSKKDVEIDLEKKGKEDIELFNIIYYYR